MSIHSILLPTKPKIIKDEQFIGIFEIDNLYPGYGHTLGNSLRRVILSSIPGAAVTSINIDGVKHEFSTIEGVKEDVISIILNIKKVKFKFYSEDKLQASLNVKGPKIVTAKDIFTPSQMEVVNKDQYLFEITSNTEVSMHLNVEKGLGYVPRELISKEKAEIGSIILDAAFTPIRRVSYEVENMRVGDRTDHNRLRIFIETDGSITAKEAFETAIQIMINQLQAIVGYREFSANLDDEEFKNKKEEKNEEKTDNDITKTKIEDLNLSTRTTNTLLAGGIKTLGGLIRKSIDDLRELDGMGEKGINEIKEKVLEYGFTLKED